MAKRTMPQARVQRPEGMRLHWDLAPKALESWSPNLAAAPVAGANDTTISIYDPIGYDPWSGDGVTANRIAAALRTIGDSADVVVNINSPGGDMFEGLAIYNLLRQHKGQVTVRVIGLAASAASVIAMAGDDIQIARAGFLMIHDCWMMVMGNRNDMRACADTLEPFDRAMADIYATRAGMKADAALAMMDSETWIGGQDAVDKGFADSLLPADQVQEQAAMAGDRIAAHVLDLALAKAGMPRSQRRAMLQEHKGGTRDAVAGDEGTRDADPQPAATPSAGGTEVLDVLKAFSLETEMQSLSVAIQGAQQ